MKRRFYKELWSLRFKKILDLEIKSAAEYQSLLDDCKKQYKGHPVEPHLEKLIADEKRHAVLAQELIVILSKQPD